MQDLPVTVAGFVASALLLSQGYFLYSLTLLLIAWLYTQRARSVPGVKPAEGWIPFFGTLLTTLQKKERLLDFSQVQTENLGKNGVSFSSFCFVGNRFLRLSPDRRTVQHILKDKFENYPITQRRTETTRELFGNGIFNSNDESWRSQRKAASHMFTANLMKGMITDACQTHLTILMKIFQKQYHAARNNSRTPPIDASDMFLRFTMDAFMQIAFGDDENSLEAETKPKFVLAFDRLQSLLLSRFINPGWRIVRFFNLGPEKLIAQDAQTLNEKAHEIIRRRRVDKTEKDLIGCFLTQAAKNGEVLSDEFLRDMVINFLVAGRDTTGTMLSWLFYELSRNPDVEAKVIEEIDSVVGTLSSLDEPHIPVTYEHSHNMPYLEAALYETLRLHPSVPSESREAKEDDVLPNGVKVPAGVSVDYSPWVYGRSKHIWGPTVLSFDPSRFLPPNSLPDQFEFPAFNGGLRLCLGKGMALQEAKMCVATILQKFLLRVIPNHEVQYVLSVTLMMKGGLPVNVIARDSLIAKGEAKEK